MNRRTALRESLTSMPLLGKVTQRLRAASVRVARARLAFGYYAGPLQQLAIWLFRSRETTNFTHALDPLNLQYLAAFVAQVTVLERQQALDYIVELETDSDLRAHILHAVSTGPMRAEADPHARYGRRAGWYAIVRATKPQVVVETGVDKGLGACVLTAALLKNRADGHPGVYYGTDINPRAGYLLGGPYEEAGTLLIGDSIQRLQNLNQTIDLFINDSDHSAAYEAREYQTIQDKLSERAIILGDNAHVTGELLAFANRTDRHFLYFQEKPDRHWYPGTGIGAAWGKQQES